MTSTRSANAAALPNARRGFLRQLAALPLVGGGISLIGSPKAVAEPVTFAMLEAYKTWLHYEHRWLSWEMADLPEMVACYGGDRVHRSHIIDAYEHHVGESASFHDPRRPPPSNRAALVMSAVGCDWRERD